MSVKFAWNGLKDKLQIVVVDSTNTSSCVFNKTQTIYTILEYMLKHAEAVGGHRKLRCHVSATFLEKLNFCTEQVMAAT